METKSIEVRSKGWAKDFRNDKPWAAISVVTDDDFPELSVENRVGLLQLSFWDINQDIINVSKKMELDNYTIFDAALARQILDFTDEMWPKIETLLVHCEAGMSRSPGIAAAIEVIYHGPRSDQKWFNTKTPNMLVYKTILNEHFGEKIL